MFTLRESQSEWSREHFIQRRHQHIDGVVMKIDASHKLVKLVRVYAPGAGADTKPTYGGVTIFNEFEQVCKGVSSRVFIWDPRVPNLVDLVI